MSASRTRTAAVADLRRWAKVAVASGSPVNKVYLDLHTSLNEVMQDFLTANDMPGARYWHHPESDSYFITAPGEHVPVESYAEELIELERYEYLSRTGLHYGDETEL